MYTERVISYVMVEPLFALREKEDQEIDNPIRMNLLLFATGLPNQTNYLNREILAFTS